MPKRSVVLCAVLVLGIVVWTCTQWSQYRLWTDLARRKHQAVEAAQVEASRILQLRELPRKAAETTPDREYLHAFLEELAGAVDLPSSAVASIQPTEPQRLGRSAYREATTTVVLKQLKLRQLAELLFLVRTRRPECQLKELRLSQTNRADATWEATVVFAFLVFEPEAEPL